MDLGFAITDTPSWRGDENNNEPTVEKMLDDILKYYHEWNAKDKKDQFQYQDALQFIRKEYIIHTQIEEGIGVNKEKVGNIMDEIDRNEEKSQSYNNDQGNMTREKNGFLNSPQNKSTTTLTQLTPTEEMINNEIVSESPQKRLETSNLYKGLRHLESIIDKENCATEKEREALEPLEQMLEISYCIQETHRILMKNIMKPEKQGEFSTLPRKVTFDGVQTFYPHFVNHSLAQTALQFLFDQYNKELTKLKGQQKKLGLTKIVLAQFFRLASIFTFAFLLLHPFSDGNGRLGRLLCSYILASFSPFPSPVYNVFSNTCRKDYCRILRTTMKTVNIDFKKPFEINYETEAFEVVENLLEVRPSELCAMIIESNWYMWKQLMDQ